MRFFLSVIKAYRVEKKRRHLERERLNSIRIHEGKPPKVSFADRIRRFMFWRNWPFIRTLLSSVHIKAGLRKLYGEEDTYRNFVFKSLAGMLSGIFLSYLFFLFLFFQLNFKITSATAYSSLLMIFLPLGLAFSQKVRCFVLLLLPTLFSKRGRQALLAYAVVLALAGPARNVLHNAEVLSQSLACNQEKLKGAAGEALDMVKQPLKAIKNAVTKVIKGIKEAVEKIKQTILNIIHVIKNILKIFIRAFKWLASIANICNRKLGTPSERCIRSFAAAIDDCRVKLGPLFSWLCSIAKLTSLICHVLKVLDFICGIIHFAGEKTVALVKRKLEVLRRQLHDAFYVEVSFSHSFQFTTNSSTTYGAVMKGIIADVKERTETLFLVFSWMSLLASFFFLLVFINVLRYWHKYLTSDKFDNHYISHHIYDIDARRMLQDRETILPLKHHEKRKYIKVTSVRLVGKEKLQVARSSLMIFLASIKLSIYIITDHCLYWLLGIIREYGNIHMQIPAPNMVGIKVEGKGPLANLYQSAVDALQPLGAPPTIDTSSCLPIPQEPDTNRHIQIAGLLVTCCILVLTEPYGQRMRHIIMNNYYPERADARAVWLYNHILRSRLNFLKFTRRQLRRKFAGSRGRGGEDGQSMENVTIRQWLAAKFPRLHFIFGPPETEKMCVLCGAVGSVKETEDKEFLISCQTFNCRGVFCETCFNELHNLCTLCKDPVEYGDLSDVSEEQDSSDDPERVDGSRKKKSIVGQRDEEGNENISETEETNSDDSLPYGYQGDNANTPLILRSNRNSFRDVERQTILDLEEESDEERNNRRNHSLWRVHPSLSFEHERNQDSK